MPPKKSVRVAIGGSSTHERDASDERDFEAIGNRRAGEDIDTAKSRYPNAGTRSQPRVRDRDGEPVRVTTVHLSSELLRRARIYCAAQETTFSALVTRLVAAELELQDRKVG